MPTKKTLIEDLNWLSNRISSQVRMIAMGLLVLVWGFLIAQPDTVPGLDSGLKRDFILVGVAALLAMLLDFLQYMIGYLYTDYVRRRAEKAEDGEAKFNYKSVPWIVRGFLFYTKRVVTAVALTYFVYLALDRIVL